MHNAALMAESKERAAIKTFFLPRINRIMMVDGRQHKSARKAFLRLLRVLLLYFQLDLARVSLNQYH